MDEKDFLEKKMYLQNYQEFFFLHIYLFFTPQIFQIF